jgi:hypothetical protein
VVNNRIEILSLLLERGADANIPNKVSRIKEGGGGGREGDCIFHPCILLSRTDILIFMKWTYAHTILIFN